MEGKKKNERWMEMKRRQVRLRLRKGKERKRKDRWMERKREQVRVR